MPARTSPRLPTIALACALAAALLLAACGGSSETATTDEHAQSRPAPPASAFPSAAGLTLAEVVKSADAPAPLVVSPAAMVFYEGRNRYPFGVFKGDRTPIEDAEVAIYVAKVPPARDMSRGKGAKQGKGAQARARRDALEVPARGPFPARIESIDTRPAFRAQTTTGDPDASGVVYVTNLDLPNAGEWRLAAMVRDGDELTATLLPSVVVGQFARVPRPGQRAPRISTPTAADVGGDRSKVTTRIPPDTQNEADLADVLGERPVILLFATPQFCQSRVCGPVVDVAEQVKETDGEGVEFIHMEIFKDNDPGKGVRPQVRAYNLPSEPWLFAIGKDGRIRTAIEGAFGVERLTEAVEGVRG